MPFHLIYVNAMFSCNTQSQNSNFSSVLIQNTPAGTFDPPKAHRSVCRPPNDMWKSHHVNDKSSCPWRYHYSTDDNRIPNVLRNATLQTCITKNNNRCLDLSQGQFVPDSSGICVPIVTENLVIRKTCIDGNVLLTPEKVTIVTGFTCVYSDVRTVRPYIVH